MNGLGSALSELAALRARLDAAPGPETDIMVCPPATLLTRARETLEGSPIMLGAQDCHPLPSGAHTGDLSAEMLADAGATAVIVGHSERRIDHGESDTLVHAKALAAYRAGLMAIICIGETESHYRDGKTLDILRSQVEGSVPEARAREYGHRLAVWAIGSGLTPTPAEVAQVHGLIRSVLGQMLGDSEAGAMRLLYGGSVKPANAAELLFVPDVNGALVGGASLKAADFYEILSVYAETRC
ncbi:triose-phosphate isomerase [Methyloceanibacter methanicus]|uniref:Triosephosphate isomerase n=2 Tax=Methyloceanibacter methanicus TaxID=1774968 RepID=A0A1E3W522_9HYPH|nr:triose-phosphate isomerase [Methyloceanibacter methanicus]